MQKFIRNILNLFKCPVRFFLIVGGVTGFFLVVLIPPLFHNDEHGHFFRCYSVSEGTLLPKKQPGNIYVGDELPQSLSDFANEAHVRPFAHHLVGEEDVAKRAEQRSRQLHAQLCPEDRVWINYWNAGNFGFLCYVPSAAFMALGRVAECSPVVLMYLGRVANLLLWLLAVAHAIRLMPSMKWFIVAYALIPMNMIVASVLSADVLTNATCLLLFASVLRCAWNPGRISAECCVSILFYTMLVMMAKPGYAAFAGLVLLIPVARIGSWRRYLAALTAYSAWAGLWFLVAVALLKPTMQNHANADPVIQRLFVMENPGAFLAALGRTLTNHDPSFFRTFFGFIYAEYTVSHSFALAYSALLILLAITDSRRGHRVTWWRRFWLIFMGTVTVFGVCLAIYLYWMPLRAGMIHWVFGRIFLPLIPPAGLLLAGTFSVSTLWRARVRRFVAVCLITTGALATWNVHYIFAIPHHNLIPNGAMLELNPNLSPKHWQCDLSKKDFRLVVPSESGLLEQQWTRSDKSAPPESQFGVEIPGIHAGRRYYFRADATTTANYTVHFDVWQKMPEDGRYSLLKRDFTRIRPKRIEHYPAFHGVFTARTNAPVLITVSSSGKETPFSGGIAWQRWSLTDDAM